LFTLKCMLDFWLRFTVVAGLQVQNKKLTSYQETRFDFVDF
jgi:hypothetical protein